MITNIVTITAAGYGCEAALDAEAFLSQNN